MAGYEPDQQIRSFTGRQWRILIVLAGCNLLAAFVQSLQAPFYPAEASKKGASATEFGFVFGVYNLIVFVAGPIIPYLFRRLRPITTFITGYLTLAISTTLFGFLDKIEDHTTFITFSFLLRILEAFGGTTVLISNYTFVTSSFQGSIATVFAVLETMFFVGSAVGPAYGGILFQAGGEDFGFILPFLVTGILVFVTSLIAVSVLPNPDPDRATGKTNDSSYGFKTLVKLPIVLVYAISALSASLSAGFINGYLEPHLRQFSLTPLSVGLVFLIYGAVNAVSAPIWGFISDRSPHPEYVAISGSLLMLAGFTTIGPLSFLPIEPSLPLIGSSIAVYGLGNAAVIISTFLLILLKAKEKGFPDNAATGSTCTGFWLSAVSLGGVIGPSLGGGLFDAYGFRVGTVVIGGILLFVSLLLLGSILARQRTSSKAATGVEGENLPLLGD